MDPASLTENTTLTDGRIILVNEKLPATASAHYPIERDFMVSMVEAKTAYKLAGDRLQQAKDMMRRMKSCADNFKNPIAR